MLVTFDKQKRDLEAAHTIIEHLMIALIPGREGADGGIVHTCPVCGVTYSYADWYATNSRIHAPDCIVGKAEHWCEDYVASQFR